MTYIPVGKVKGWAGDPVTALGADMEDLGELGNFSFMWQPLDTVVAINGVGYADGYHSEGAILRGRLEIYDQATANIVRFMPQFALTGTSLGFGRSGLVTPRSLCILPVDEVADGVASDYGFWYPAYRVTNSPESTYNAKPQNGLLDNPLVIEFEALKRVVDSGDTAIPATAQTGFIGQPDDHGLTWTLPAPPE